MIPLLGTRTRQELERFFSSDRHAAVLVGHGTSVFDKELEVLAKTGHTNTVVLHLRPEKSVITIDQMRELKRSLSLRQLQSEHRLLVINDAETMTQEAQNSFLKLLEEPPAGVRFLLLTHHRGALLATITSRASVLRTRRLTLEEALHHYEAQGAQKAKITKSYAIANGLPGKLYALLADDDDAYSEAIEQAKTLVSAPPFERLLHVEALSKDKQYALQVLEAIDDVLRAVSHAQATSSQKIKDLAAKRLKVYKATESLQKNTNAKLLLLDVFLVL